jgi:hypothetical protein
MRRSVTLESKEQPATADSEKILRQEMVMAAASHLPLLVIGPLLVALVVYLLAPHSPAEYRSVALIRMDREHARALEALVTATPVASEILWKYAGAGDTPERRAAFLSRHFHLVDPEPVSERPGDRLYRLEVTHTDPKTAQAIASDLIEESLERVPGIPRSAVVQLPHLPQDPVPPPARALAVLFGVAAIPVLFSLIVLGRYFAPGVSVYALLSRKLRRAA